MKQLIHCRGRQKDGTYNPLKTRLRIDKYIEVIKFENENFISIKELDDKYLISNFGRIIKKMYRNAANQIIKHSLIKVYNNSKGYYFLNNDNKIYINEYFNKYFNKNINEVINNNSKNIKLNNINNCGYERKIIVIKNNKTISVLNITKTCKLYNISSNTIKKILNKDIEYKGYIFKDYIDNDKLDKKKIILKF